MLSYQHLYHAGNLPDVHKHAALALILSRLLLKDRPLTFMETHSGRGLYDLSSPEARKTDEAKTGIVALQAAEKVPAAHPYARALAAVRAKYGPNCYPGSPTLAEAMLRPNDRMQLMELHPQEFKALSDNMQAPNIHLHKRDGYEGALALSPPTPRRGLLLIDPSYEIKDEYTKVAEFIPQLHRKWPEATILLWYPILEAGLHIPMRDALVKANLPELWQQEVRFGADSGLRMQGSGLLCVNLPLGAERGLGEVGRWFDNSG